MECSMSDFCNCKELAWYVWHVAERLIRLSMHSSRSRGYFRRRWPRSIKATGDTCGELRGRSIVWLHRMTKGRNGEQTESLVEMAWTGDARRSWPLRVSHGPLLCGWGSEILTLAAGERNLITFSGYMPDPHGFGVCRERNVWATTFTGKGMYYDHIYASE